MTLIDLRSDTITQPTVAMRRAMRAAVLGDDSLDGDPTVRELERISASIMGKDDALFVVNLFMLRVCHKRATDESLCSMFSQLG